MYILKTKLRIVYSIFQQTLRFLLTSIKPNLGFTECRLKQCTSHNVYIIILVGSDIFLRSVHTFREVFFSLSTMQFTKTYFFLSLH